MTDVFVMDALYGLLDADFADTLDDAAFGEAMKARTAYLAGAVLE